ncbi:MAG: hypothetical protein AAF152_04645 [Cyanobacteria bacterium P01_A01_bin.114]
MKSASKSASKSAFLPLAFLPALFATFSALPAQADLPCYMAYPGSHTLDLAELCGGAPSFEDADVLQLRVTHPVIETTTVTGDIIEGRTLAGTFYNPHGRMSNRVTLLYSVQTTEELKMGTMMAPAIAPNARTQVEVAMPDLRGVVESYRFEILD